MADRQLEAVMAELAAITTSARALAAQVPDLHSLAYDRSVTGNVGGKEQKKKFNPPGVETHGNEHAQELWHRLMACAAHTEIALRKLEWAVGNMLSQGGSPEDTRGSHIQRSEFRAALKQQRARIERGEYVPVRTIEQPPYPGTTGK